MGIGEKMANLDLWVVIAYVGVVFWLAWRVGGGRLNASASAEDQYLAGRSLSFTESILSIIATEVSALTFLGIPAFAFNQHFGFVQIYFGAILGRLLIALVFLPKIYGQGLTIYEAMARGSRSNRGRKTVAVFYALSKIFSVGVRLFSGSILVASFLGIDVYLGLATVTFVTFLYTLIGGLKAVVRTDIMQMGIFVLGGLVAHVLIPHVAGQSWSELMALAHGAGKTMIFDWSQPMSIVAGVLGGVLFDMSTHGVDQDFAQRLTANRSMRKAQQAIFFSSFLSISVGLLFLGIGALLWAYYQSHLFPAKVPNADHLFAHFIVEHFPAGLRGLMVAGVLAATMSTLDSTINALCATVTNDILPQRSGRSLGQYFLIDNVVITLLLFTVAVVASQNDGLLLLGLKVQSWTAGALLSLFVARILLARTFSGEFTAMQVVVAYVAGVGGVALNTLWLAGNWNWNTYFGCGLGLTALFLWKKSSELRKP